MSKSITTGLWLATMTAAGLVAATVDPASQSFWLAEAMLVIGFFVTLVAMSLTNGSDDQADSERQLFQADAYGFQPIPVRVRAQR